jgi:hypothetical protein
LHQTDKQRPSACLRRTAAVRGDAHGARITVFSFDF